MSQNDILIEFGSFGIRAQKPTFIRLLRPAQMGNLFYLRDNLLFIGMFTLQRKSCKSYEKNMKWILMKDCLTLIKLGIFIDSDFFWEGEGGRHRCPLCILVIAQPNRMKFGILTVLEKFYLKLHRKFNFMQ